MAVAESANQAAVGDELPIFVRTTDFHNWNRFAAVNYEFVPIHMDDEAGRTAGHAAAIGMGNLQLAYLHNLLRNWIGEEGRILKIGCQFRATNTRGQTVTARGVVKEIREEGGAKEVDLEIWLENEEGTKLAPGSGSRRRGMSGSLR
jgi:acyl dehydratase